MKNIICCHRLQKNITIILHPAPFSGIFVAVIFSEIICAELTTELASSLTQKKIINQLAIVNRVGIINSLSYCCKDTIFPTVKPAQSIVNNRTPVSSTRQLKNINNRVKTNRFLTKNTRLTTYYLPLTTTTFTTHRLRPPANYRIPLLNAIFTFSISKQ